MDADLHHDGYVEFAAFGIVRIIFGVVGCEAEPVRIEMSADEARVFFTVNYRSRSPFIPRV
jgi:hypothetical protein